MEPEVHTFPKHLSTLTLLASGSCPVTLTLEPRTSKPNKFQTGLAPILLGLDLFSSTRQNLPASACFLLKLTSVAGRHQRQGCAFNVIPGRPRLGSQALPCPPPFHLSWVAWAWFSWEGQNRSFGHSRLFDICTKENCRARRTSSRHFSSKCPARTDQFFFLFSKILFIYC